MFVSGESSRDTEGGRKCTEGRKRKWRKIRRGEACKLTDASASSES